MTDAIAKKILELAKEKAPAFQFCATHEMATALSKLLSDKWIAPENGAFVLTKLGERELKRKPKVQLPLLTHSEIQTFQRCPREHHLRYRLRRRPKMDAHELRFGKVFDESLQTWWSLGPLHGLEGANARLDELAKDPKLLNPYDVEKVRALLVVYDARWGNEPYEIIRVQPTFRQAIVNPVTGRKSKKFDLGGKLDVLVRDIRTGEIVIIETKTTKSTIENTSSYWHTISVIDPQVSTYFTGARAILRTLGIKEDPQKCVYDVVRKPQLKPLKATPIEKREYLKKDPTKLYANQRLDDETVQEYSDRVMEDLLGQVPQSGIGFDVKLALETLQGHLARKDIVRLEHEEYDHAMNVWQIAKIISDFEEEKIAPQHKGWQCKRCPYLPVCSGTALIESYELSDEKHEELKEI